MEVRQKARPLRQLRPVRRHTLLSQIEVCQSRAACGQRPLSLRSPFRPTCSDHPTEYTCTRQLVALRTRAKNNFTTPLTVCTANAINAVLKMCIPPYLAQFSCHDPHPTPSGTARAANFPDLRARRSIWPKICLPSSASQPHFSLVLSQSPARGAHRSQATPIEIHTFGSPTRSRVRLPHHKGEKQHSQRLCPNWPTKSY